MQVWSVAGPKRWLVVWMAIFLTSSLLLVIWEALYSRWQSFESVGISPLAQLRMRTVWLTTLPMIVAAVVALSSRSAPELVYRDF